MDLLKPGSGISPEKWGIRTNVEAEERRADRAPARYGAEAQVTGSMISAGCTINGTVVNSVLAPGVVVEQGAVVKDSILFADCVVETDASVDLAIFDKRVHVGSGAVIGAGNNHHIPNRKQPTHLYTGITLVGKEAVIPRGLVVGRNCIINSHTHYDAYPGNAVADGESV